MAHGGLDGLTGLTNNKNILLPNHRRLANAGRLLLSPKGCELIAMRLNYINAIISILILNLIIATNCKQETGPERARREHLESACSEKIDFSKYHATLEGAVMNYFNALATRKPHSNLNLPTREEYVEQYWCHLEDKWTMNMNNSLESMLDVDQQMRDIVVSGMSDRFAGREVELVSIKEKRRDEYDDITAIYISEIELIVDDNRWSVDEIKLIVERDNKYRIMKVAP